MMLLLLSVCESERTPRPPARPAHVCAAVRVCVWDPVSVGLNLETGGPDFYQLPEAYLSLAQGLNLETPRWRSAVIAQTTSKHRVRPPAPACCCTAAPR